MHCTNEFRRAGKIWFDFSQMNHPVTQIEISIQIWTCMTIKCKSTISVKMFCESSPGGYTNCTEYIFLEYFDRNFKCFLQFFVALCKILSKIENGNIWNLRCALENFQCFHRKKSICASKFKLNWDKSQKKRTFVTEKHLKFRSMEYLKKVGLKLHYQITEHRKHFHKIPLDTLDLHPLIFIAMRISEKNQTKWF